MEAIILAGGMGTRLKEIINDIPKPMAKVNNKPFLEYLFEFLLSKGIKKVILSVGYKAEIIQEYFKDNYKGIEVEYSVETEPLGTGGAIKKGLDLAKNDCFVINGDTFFDVDLKSIYEHHKEKNADLTVCLKELKNFDRYGTVEINPNGKITNFIEKQQTSFGLINGGIYLIKKDILKQMPEKFSFEKDFMEQFLETKQFYGIEQKGFFIDIGIPEDYKKAQVTM